MHPTVAIIREVLAGIIGPTNSDILLDSLMDDLQIEPDMASQEEIKKLATELTDTIKDLIGLQGIALLKQLVRERVKMEMPPLEDPWD